MSCMGFSRKVQGALQGFYQLFALVVIYFCKTQITTMEFYEFRQKVIKILVDFLVVAGIVAARLKGRSGSDGLIDVQDIGGSVVPRIGIDFNILPVILAIPRIQSKRPIFDPQSVHAAAASRSAIQPNDERNIGFVLLHAAVLFCFFFFN